MTEISPKRLLFWQVVCYQQETNVMQVIYGKFDLGGKVKIIKSYTVVNEFVKKNTASYVFPLKNSYLLYNFINTLYTQKKNRFTVFIYYHSS